jgi:hypothetical protein
MIVPEVFESVPFELVTHAAPASAVRARASTFGYLIVVPRPTPAAPRRYLIVVAKRLPAVVVCSRYLIVVPRPLPEKPFLVRRRYLIVVPRPAPRPLPAATRRCRSRRRTLGR